MASSYTKLIDLDLLAYFKSKIDLLFTGKVDKENGKGLSSNDYTSNEKTKLSGIATGAQVNVLEGIQKNGQTVSITNKIANISVPTATSDLTNDSGFITIEDVPEGSTASTTTPKMDGTAAVGSETAFARGDHRHPTDTTRAPLASPGLTGTPTAPTAAAGTNTTQIATTAFVQAAIDNKLSATLKYKGTKTTVAELPSSGNQTGDTWHVTETGGEYAWNGSTWEELGSTIDLSGYAEWDDLGFATTTEIDNLFVTE